MRGVTLGCLRCLDEAGWLEGWIPVAMSPVEARGLAGKILLQNSVGRGGGFALLTKYFIYLSVPQLNVIQVVSRLSLL